MRDRSRFSASTELRSRPVLNQRELNRLELQLIRASIAFQDAGRKPSLIGCIADEKHGTGARSRRWGCQHIVDLEIAVGLERDADEGRIV